MKFFCVMIICAMISTLSVVASNSKFAGEWESTNIEKQNESNKLESFRILLRRDKQFAVEITRNRKHNNKNRFKGTYTIIKNELTLSAGKKKMVYEILIKQRKLILKNASVNITLSKAKKERKNKNPETIFDLTLDDFILKNREHICCHNGPCCASHGCCTKTACIKLSCPKLNKNLK